MPPALRPLPLFAAALALAGCVTGSPGTATSAPQQARPAGPATGPGPLIMQPELLTPDASDRLAFEQAVAADSNAALIMFLARNPDSPRAGEARARLAARQSPDSAAARQAAAGHDAGVVAEFDAARLSGDAALRAFLARHGSHPLAAEARRLMAR